MDKLTKFLERIFIKFNAWVILLRKERNNIKTLDLNKLYLLTRGFSSIRSTTYDFDDHERSDYISDLEGIKIAYLNYPYGRLIRDKLVFSNFFSSYFKTPECFCLMDNGVIKPVNQKVCIGSIDSFIELLNGKKLILKPLFGTDGHGIIVAEKGRSNKFLLNRESYSRSDLVEYIRKIDNCLVSEYIEQGNFSKSFFPDTANTIRLTTMFNPRKGCAFIPYSNMRFGRTNTFPVDNVSSGGLFSIIDLRSGKLNDAVEITNDGKLIHHEYHPDTNVRIKAAIIPDWEFLCDFFVNVGNLISPFIKVAGWDIILTDDSFFVIEGNNGPSLNIQRIDYPLARNNETREFLEYFKLR